MKLLLEGCSTVRIGAVLPDPNVAPPVPPVRLSPAGTMLRRISQPVDE